MEWSYRGELGTLASPVQCVAADDWVEEAFWRGRRVDGMGKADSISTVSNAPIERLVFLVRIVDTTTASLLQATAWSEGVVPAWTGKRLLLALAALMTRWRRSLRPAIRQLHETDGHGTAAAHASRPPPTVDPLPGPGGDMPSPPPPKPPVGGVAPAATSAHKCRPGTGQRVPW